METQKESFSKKFAKVPTGFNSNTLEAGDILVFAHINIHKNGKTGLCNPSINTICEESGFSKKFVLGSINRLEQAGYFIVDRKERRSNHYTFTEKGKKFERFTESFLKIKDLSKTTKDFYMRIQEYLYIHEDGTADTTYSVSDLAKLTDLDPRTVKKHLIELKEKGYMRYEDALTTNNSGLANIRFVFSLDALGQQLLYKVAEHEDRITVLEKRVNSLEQKDYETQKELARKDKYIQYLERKLRFSDAKEVAYKKEYSFEA